MTGRGRRRCKQLLDGFKEKRGYWKLEGESIDGAVWRIRCGRICGPVVRHTTEWMKPGGI